jgi:hypothetical protein
MEVFKASGIDPDLAIPHKWPEFETNTRFVSSFDRPTNEKASSTVPTQSFTFYFSNEEHITLSRDEKIEQSASLNSCFSAIDLTE